MKLSVIIVNYNVKYFLEQCLLSVASAIKGYEVEVFVVDNNSVDGSQSLVKEKFPWVKLIDNKENLGFSKANNQAIRQSTGEYVLLLNPDTVVEENTFDKVIAFMDSHPDAGGLGVYMLDGKGRFLPESKRGLPTPSVAFYKIFGLARLFPGSRIFGKYHLGYLDRNQTHTVDVLSGAFMLLRRKALDETGLLDEDYFMYGEDIDLSYRITKAGYRNYYYPETRIIHYKGESTRKSSTNYVFTFYNAMIIFARKHFSQKHARAFSFLIRIAIYLKILMALASRSFNRLFPAVLDAILLFAGLWFIKGYWEQNVVFGDGGHYPGGLIAFAVPAYILVWLLSVFFSGGYDRPVRIIRILQGLFTGTIIILVIYSLLPETYRFSRALIVLGAVWGLISMTGIRYAFHLAGIKAYRIESEQNKRFLIVGSPDESKRVESLLRQSFSNPGFIGIVSTAGDEAGPDGVLGSLSQLHEIIEIYRINEIIFCARDIPAEKIIDLMTGLRKKEVDYKIAPTESLSIIGSNSINTSGDLYTIDLHAITQASSKRNKALVDFITSIFLLVSLPVNIFIIKSPGGLIINILAVLLRKRSWVGYIIGEGIATSHLPDIRPGILTPADAFKSRKLTLFTMNNLNMLYARDYRISGDISILYRGYRDLGRKPAKT